MRVALVGLAVFAVVSTGSSAVAGPPTSGRVVIVHGVRGLVANVDVDGNRVLSGFQPERTTDPLTLPAGPHALVLRRANDPAAAPVLQQQLTVRAGSVESAALGLTAAGRPALTVFDDRGSAVPVGRARLVVRHIAAGPAVQVTVDGRPMGAMIGPGSQQASVDLAAGSHPIAVTAANGAQVLAPQAVPLRAGRVTTLYLIGSVPSGTLTWLARISDTGDLRGVPTGTDGLAADRGLPQRPMLALLLIPFLAVLSMRRRHR